MNKQKVTNKIKSVKDVIESIHFCGFEKGEIIFRGQINSDWDILPSLYRKSKDKKEAVVYDNLLYEAASVAHLFLNIESPFVHSNDPIEYLMTAQHFGQPTRLVDWTTDILVGLFFACYDPDNIAINKDGKLTLTEKSFFNTFKINSKDQLEYKNPFSNQELEKFNRRLSINDINILEPLIKNPRMRVQEGCFMFFPWEFHQDKSKFLTLNYYIKEKRKLIEFKNIKEPNIHPHIYIDYLIIDKNYKLDILKELEDKYGISKETLYVDSKYSEETEKYFEKNKEKAEQIVIELK